MADALGADSLRYLPVESIARCVGIESSSLCQACINGDYPTAAGRQLYQLALEASHRPADSSGRIYDLKPLATANHR
jgi:amidophosphoribosyltransferase